MAILLAKHGQRLAWIPFRVKQSGFDRCTKSLSHRQARIQNRPTHFEMRIECFASNKEAHDFAGAFKDRINAAIAHETFKWYWFFTTSFQRRSSFITAATAYLDR